MKLIACLLSACILLAIATVAKGQDCNDFFPLEEGMVLRYVHCDRKDKVTGSSELSFKEKKEYEDYTSVVFRSVYSDKKGEALFENEVEVDCKDGILYFSSSEYLDPSAMSAYESMEVEVDATHMEIPLNATTGTRLKDGSVSAVVRNKGMKIVAISLKVFNRRVEAIETIETPAGSFKCIRSSYDALSEIGFAKVDMSGIEWHNPGVGTIRTETYNKKGKLLSYTVLESIE